jgi:hypothetical protein
MSRAAFCTITLLIPLVQFGCVKQPLPEYKVVSPTTSAPPPAPERSTDPGMQGASGQAAFSLMNRSGYLECPIALRAVEEAQVSPDFRQQIVHYFTNYQAKLRPLIDEAKKKPSDIDALITRAKDVTASFAPESNHISADPQFPQFKRRLDVVQAQVGLLTANPTAFEGGFDQLQVTPAQREKLDVILKNADKQLQSQQTSAFNGGNLADLAEQTVQNGLQTRASLRVVLTPEQNKMWDTLAVPAATQPAR